jgi:LmeA-like phospholipid-binding
VSDYQSRGQGGWPTQPPADGGYGQPDDGYGQAPTGAFGQGPAAPPRRRRRRRWPIVLLVVVVLLLAVLGVGDQVLKSYAENRIAQQIKTSANLTAKPSVSIEGWPVFTQFLARDLKTVDISANDMTTAGGKLPVNFTAKATGVHINSSFNGATVDHVSGQATITYQALDTYLANSIGIQGLGSITFTPDPAAGPNVVKADAGIGSVDATVLKTAPNQITVKFGSVSGLASLLGGSGTIPDQTIDIPPLPAGVVLGNPEVTSQGVVIPASASNTTLTQ